MTITIDQAQIGTPVGLGTSANTVAITTNVTIAANGLIVLVLGWDTPAVTLNGVAGGGLTWTIDRQDFNATSTDRVAIVSAPAVAGLASGTTITGTYASSLNSSSRMLGGMSILGADLTGSRVDGTPNSNSTTAGAGLTWATASYTIAAGSILVAGVEYDLNADSTASAGTTQAWQVKEATGGNTTVQAYRIEAAGGSFTCAGTITGASSTLPEINIAVAYKAAAAAAATDSTYIASLGRRPVPMIAGPDTDQIMRMYRRG